MCIWEMQDIMLRSDAQYNTRESGFFYLASEHLTTSET